MCLWNGVARVLDKGGFTKLLGRMISPFLAIAFPKSYAEKNGMKECATNICANFLGLGSAALPTGLEAMKKLCENSTSEKGKASDDAVMLAVLATTPFQLLPNTLAAMRKAFGSVMPYDVLLPIWICEIATTFFAIAVCKLLSRVF
jgi:spore maturation protein A